MTHPAPTIADLIGIWQSSLEAVADVCAPLADEQWHAQTPCPGWQVADVAAHVVDIEQTLAGMPRPDHQPDWSALPHVDRDLSRFTEIGVDARRGRSRDSVIAELRDVIAVRREQLADVPPGAEVMGPLGRPTTIERLLRVRIFDTWVHEQDIRTAIADEGHWDSAPARISLEQMAQSLPYVWARTVAAPEGATVRISVTGPGLADAITAVAEADSTGRIVDEVTSPTVSLTASWPDYMRLAAGRLDPDDEALRARITLAGDPALGAALLPALSITP
jgi:uncharacterized protein (TIGR03083 family)